MTKGIDISHHNSDDPGHRPIDWQKVAGIAAPGGPVRFAMIKISEGADFRDPTAAANAQGAKNAGVLFGYYHFARPGANNAADEARNFYDTYTGIGIPPTFSFPFALDLEQNNGLDSAAYLAWVEGFMQTFLGHFAGVAGLAIGIILPEAPGAIGSAAITGPAETESASLSASRILIYGAPDFLKANLPAGHTLGSRFPLWVADPAVATPTLPPGWTDWAVWQYDWHDKIAGIVGDVDADWLRQ